MLERPKTYLTWQSTHAHGKFEALKGELDVRPGGRILDVGCGPGTNAQLFIGSSYVGVDINPAYIEYARTRFPDHRFVIHDLRLPFQVDGPFDLVLANSFFHHVDLDTTRKILANLARSLAPGGRVLVLELTLPPWSAPLKRLVAKMDRGDFVRPYEEWTRIMGEHFTIAATRPFSLRFFGTVSLWDMAFYKLVAKQGGA